MRVYVYMIAFFSSKFSTFLFFSNHFLSSHPKKKDKTRTFFFLFISPSFLSYFPSPFSFSLTFSSSLTLALPYSYPSPSASLPLPHLPSFLFLICCLIELKGKEWPPYIPAWPPPHWLVVLWASRTASQSGMRLRRRSGMLGITLSNRVRGIPGDRRGVEGRKEGKDGMERRGWEWL